FGSFFLRTAGHISWIFSTRSKYVPMDQISCDLPCENIAIELFRKGISQVHSSSGSTCKMIFRIFCPIQILLLIGFVASSGPLRSPIGRGCFLEHYQVVV